MNHDALQSGAEARPHGAEAAFAHLEELLERLPAMQEKGAALTGARHAEAVAQAADACSACGAMLELAEEELAKAEDTLARARDCDDEATVDACRRAALFAASLRGFRLGPARNAARLVDEAVAASPFPDVQSACATRLRQDELKRLEAEVDAYRKDYAETLAECERWESASGDL